MAREITRKSWENWRKIADDLEYELDDEMPRSRWTKAALITAAGRAIVGEFGEIGMESADVAACFAALPKSELERMLAQRNSRWIGNKWRGRWVPFFEVTWWNAAAIARENDLPIWRRIHVAWNRKSICNEIEGMDARDRFEDLLENWGHLAVA